MASFAYVNKLIPSIDLFMKNVKKIAEICDYCISSNIKDIWGTIS